MELILFVFITITSLVIAYFLRINFMKRSLVISFLKVAKNYDLRIEQKEQLSKFVDEYHNALPIEAHDSLINLDSSLSKVKNKLNNTEFALESNSIFEINSAKKEIEKLYKKENKKNKTQSFSKQSRIKATWEYSAEEIVSLVSKMIKETSKAQKALGCKVPSKYSRKIPTNIALREISKLAS